MIIPENYIDIGGIDILSDTYPIYFIPSVTKDDYKKGYIYRYFVKKINDLTITEVNKNNYNSISYNFYIKEYIKWVISGPENNEYRNKILYREGVRQINSKTLADTEKKMKGIKSYLNNPLEFWGGK
ncbi:MAG: hypothetical protein RL086_489 [Bacteroidota bacterium]|jgi:hypothetical protein